MTPRPNRHTKNKIWYAWRHYDHFLDGPEEKERIYKSTGCSLKSEALKKVEEWREEDRLKSAGTLKMLAKDYFVPGKCPYLDWKKLKERTIYEHRKSLTKHILPKYGDRFPSTITAPEVELWLKNEYPDKKTS